MRRDAVSKKTVAKIEKLAEGVLKAVAGGKTPFLDIPVDSGKTTSIRDLYYVTKHTIGDTRQNTFEEQDESDPIIEDLEVTLDALREELHLFAARKGSLVGPLTITDSGDTIDLRRMGSGGGAVPSIVEDNVITFRRHEAKSLL